MRSWIGKGFDFNFVVAPLSTSCPRILKETGLIKSDGDNRESEGFREEEKTRGIKFDFRTEVLQQYSMGLYTEWLE
jgi:hypothetical protein